MSLNLAARRHDPVINALVAHEAAEDKAYRRELAIDTRAEQLDDADVIENLTDMERRCLATNLRAFLNGTGLSQKIAYAELKRLMHFAALRIAEEQLDKEAAEGFEVWA